MAKLNSESKLAQNPVSADEVLLKKLAASQRATGLLSCDLANILSITPCYLSMIRLRVQVSKYMTPRIKYAIKTLSMYQKSVKTPIFQKHLAESTAQFRKRRDKMVTSFKSAFMTILKTIDSKG